MMEIVLWIPRRVVASVSLMIVCIQILIRWSSVMRMGLRIITRGVRILIRKRVIVIALEAHSGYEMLIDCRRIPVMLDIRCNLPQN